MKTTTLISLALLTFTSVACSDSKDSGDSDSAAEVVAETSAPSVSEGNAGAAPAAKAEAVSNETPSNSGEPASTAEAAKVIGTEVNATNKEAWAHLDLDTLKIVDGADSSWDLAFKRTSIKMNSDVKAAVIKDTPFEAVNKAPESGYASDAPVAGGLETDGLLFHSPSAWYSYNMELHVISSRNYVYVVQTNGGRHVKLAVSDYYNADRLPSFIQLKSQDLGVSPAAVAAE